MIFPDPEKYILCQKTYSPEIPVGISESDFDENSIQIYPNPVISDLNIRIDNLFDDVNLSIFGMNGRLVNEVNFTSGTHVISMDNLKAGVYIYVFQENGSIVNTGKIIVK
jgi:hypothetical protein